MKYLNTSRLKLIACEVHILKAAIESNQQLEKLLHVNVPDHWTEFGMEAMKYAMNKLAEDENDHGWWTYLPIHLADHMLIGSCGYKGKPTEDGIVEIGYEVTPAYRNRGYATEMCGALLENAFSYLQVTQVIAHTLAEENASARVLAKCGFIQVRELTDPEDGLIWRWETGRKSV